MLTGLFKKRQSHAVGGPIGSMADAKSPSLSYPQYDAAYLLNRLAGQKYPISSERLKDRYRPDVFLPGAGAKTLDMAEKMVYLMNATKGHEAEAEECLKKEFKLWLAGRHPDNVAQRKYDNTAGGLVRRDARGEPLDDWCPTWWGTKQLTHLPGVREYLREEYANADKNSFEMNQLANYGPNNLEEAFAYFKYWVKGRPVDEKCMVKEVDQTKHPFERSGPVSMGPTDAYDVLTKREGMPKREATEMIRESEESAQEYRNAIDVEQLVRNAIDRALAYEAEYEEDSTQPPQTPEVQYDDVQVDDDVPVTEQEWKEYFIQGEIRRAFTVDEWKDIFRSNEFLDLTTNLSEYEKYFAKHDGVNEEEMRETYLKLSPSDQEIFVKQIEDLIESMKVQTTVHGIYRLRIGQANLSKRYQRMTEVPGYEEREKRQADLEIAEEQARKERLQQVEKERLASETLVQFAEQSELDIAEKLSKLDISEQSAPKDTSEQSAPSASEFATAPIQPAALRTRAQTRAQKRPMTPMIPLGTPRDPNPPNRESIRTPPNIFNGNDDLV